MNPPDLIHSSPNTPSALRHVTLLAAELAEFESWTGLHVDSAANAAGRQRLTLIEIILTRDQAGQILQTTSGSVLAVFPTASSALNRALEIQRVLHVPALDSSPSPVPAVRIGLHTGEVLIRETDHVEIISRHLHRARALMAAASPGQILTSDAVVEAARDFIELPQPHLAIQHFGDFYLQGHGAIDLCEVADLRLRKPAPPDLAQTHKPEHVLMARLELAGFRVLERLGEGPHGVVYRAESLSSRQGIALKVFHSNPETAAANLSLFSPEQHRLLALNLPGIQKILEERWDHRPPFLVAEWIEGQSLDTALAQAPPAEVASLFHRLCMILVPLHEQDLAHGNVKPTNVLVNQQGSLTLLDMTAGSLHGLPQNPAAYSATTASNPAYLAPELLQGQTPGPASDVYALGILLFKVLTGHEPFQGTSVHQIVQDQLHADPPLPVSLNPQVSDSLQRVCLKALEKNPADRYPSAQAMAADLDRVAHGELVRTRPSAYDNLLVHRVHQHVANLQNWADRGLLNEEEHHALLAAYQGLQRRGLPAVMEGRVYRFWQMMIYVGGWSVINGAILWLVLHWTELGRASKLLLGSLPALTAFAMGVSMWKLERFRLAFVALIVAVLAVPLFTGVWLSEFKIASQVPQDQVLSQLLHDSTDSQKLTNAQLLLTALVTLAAAGFVMYHTRTTAHSTQALLALAFAYSCILLWFGFKHDLDHEHWATLALKYLPLLVACTLLAQALLRHPHRAYQAPPWIYAAGLLLSLLLAAVAFHGLDEWTPMEKTFRVPLSYLLLSLNGAFLTGCGLLARHYLKHTCRMATFALVLLGLIGVLAGFTLAGQEDVWPASWWRPSLFNAAVPAPLLLLPAISLGITLLACRFHMITFLLIGLAGFAASIHLLGARYFTSSAAWPKCLIALGALCFFAALFLELRRTRGNVLDDLLSKSRF